MKKIMPLWNNYIDHKLYSFIGFMLNFFLLSSLIYTVCDGIGSIWNLLLWLIVSLVLSPITSMAITKISKITISESTDGNIIVRIIVTSSWLCTIILLLCHSIIFLAFYPGICTFDLPAQIEQYETGAFCLNHPLIHTLYIGFFKNLFNEANTGYAVANFLQLLCMDIAIGIVLAWINRRHGNTLIGALLLAHFIINPIYAFMGISSTKDIYFSIAVFAFCCLFLNIENGPACNTAGLIVTAVMMMLLRNNAKYAFIPSMIIIIIIFLPDKEILRRLLLIAISAFTLFALCSSILTSTLNAHKGSIKEMMSLFAQEQARIYNYSDTQGDLDKVREYIEEPERYKYYISDPVKEQLPFEVLDSKCKHFLLDSAILAVKHPIIFFDSVMYNTQGYWDIFHAPYQSNHSYIASEGYRAGAELDSKIPLLQSVCLRYLQKSDLIDRIPILAIFLDNGLYIWLCIILFAISIDRKDKKSISVLLFLGIYMCTLLLGPAAFTRYAYPYIIIAPILLIYTLAGRKVAKNEEINEL